MDKHHASRSTALAVFVLIALALIVRLPELGHRVFIDELMHVLSARSLLETGTLQINAGGSPYTRAALFTYLIAGLFRVFGESLIIARIPALIGSVLLVVTLFLWLRSTAGSLAAWTAAVLLCLNPEAIYLSQWCRFYTLQALFLLLGAIATYALVHGTAPPRRRVWHAAVAVACFALAMHLQVLSTICLLTLAIWGATVLVPRLFARTSRAGAAIYSAALAVVGLVAGLLLVESGFVGYAWRMFRHVAPWAARARNDHFYYHSMLVNEYATLWTLFPLVCLLALSAHRRAAWFCCCIFGAGIVFQSAAAWKSDRYLFWAMPYFFAIVGMGFEPAVGWIRQRLAQWADEATARRLSPRTIHLAVDAALVLALLFAAAGNRAFLEDRSLLVDEDAPGRLIRPEANWAAALPLLRQTAADSEVVGSSAGPKAIYFLRRLDFAIDYDEEDIETSGSEFSDVLAVPLVRSVDSLAHLMTCHPTGLVVIEKQHAGHKVEPAMMDYLSAHANRLPLPPGWRLEAFHWDHPPGNPATDCSEDPLASNSGPPSGPDGSDRAH